MDESLHTFTIKTTFAHEDEGTASSSAASVIKIVENVKNTFPGVVTSRQLARSMKVILEPKGFTLDKTLLVTSFCCDEVCRDLEDELKKNFGQVSWHTYLSSCLWVFHVQHDCLICLFCRISILEE